MTTDKTPATKEPRARGPVIRYFYSCPVTGCEIETDRHATTRGAEIYLQRHVLSHAKLKKVEIKRQVNEVEVP